MVFTPSQKNLKFILLILSLLLITLLPIPSHAGLIHWPLDSDEVIKPIPDTDGDGINDNFEDISGMDKTNPIDVNEDFDGDGLTNIEEFLEGTNLNNADTDGDGVEDGIEVARGDDPRRSLGHICKNKYRSLSTRKYWYWETLSKSKNVIEDKVYRRGNNPRHFWCYEIKISKLNNIMQRTYGIKDALRDIIDEPEWGNKPAWWQSKTYLEILQEITGETLTNHEQWEQWWLENMDYLLWSDQLGRLIIDEQSKNNLKPVSRITVPIDSRRFWDLIVADDIRSLKITNNGKYLTGRSLAYRGRFSFVWFTVPIEALADTFTQEKAYKYAATVNIKFFRRLTEFPEEYTGLTRSYFFPQTIRSMKFLTELKFDSKEEWISWWDAYNKNIVLSEDRTHLTAKTITIIPIEN